MYVYHLRRTKLINNLSRKQVNFLFNFHNENQVLSKMIFTNNFSNYKK